MCNFNHSTLTFNRRKMKRLFGFFAVVAMAMVIVMFAVNVNATIGDRNTHQPNINPKQNKKG